MHTNKIKVNVSVVGRFHAFDLAYQLQNQGYLNKLITTYPKFITQRWGINKKNIISEIGLEIFRRYGHRVPLISGHFLDRIANCLHAKHAAKYVKECDVVICWSDSGLETLITAKKLGKITILERGSSHSNFWKKILLEEHSKHDLLFDLNYKAWQQELLEYELADYISIPSTFVKRTFIENGIPEKKLLVNPYGVNLSMFKQVEKEDAIFRIIYAGGGTLQKGYHYLLQAFYELNLPNCELWHLGSITNEIQPFLKKYNHKNWILKGHKPQHELYKYYSQGNVFVMPSIQEGFAMVQFQAMACGLPLICTTNTGGEDLITTDGNEGFVIPIRDIDALKVKILYLYNNQNIAKEMGQRAKQKVINGFTWDDYGTRYIKNIEDICAEKNQ